MASRRGTFLSDENVKRMCVAGSQLPMNKAYGLIREQGVVKLPQRPKNVGVYLRALARSSGKSFNDLKSQYVQQVNMIAPEASQVIPPPRTRVDQVAKMQPIASGAQIVSPQVLELRDMLRGLQQTGTRAPTGLGTIGAFSNPQQRSIAAFFAQTPAQQQQLLLQEYTAAIAGAPDPERMRAAFNMMSIKTATINNSSADERLRLLLHMDQILEMEHQRAQAPAPAPAPQPQPPPSPAPETPSPRIQRVSQEVS